jgi:hypothetical protein
MQRQHVVDDRNAILSVAFVKPVGGDHPQPRLVAETFEFAVDVFVSPMRVSDERALTDEVNSWGAAWWDGHGVHTG